MLVIIQLKAIFGTVFSSSAAVDVGWPCPFEGWVESYWNLKTNNQTNKKKSVFFMDGVEKKEI